MTYNTENLIPLSDKIKSLEQDIEEYYWIEQEELAESLERELTTLRKQHLDGDVWYPLF